MFFGQVFMPKAMYDSLTSPHPDARFEALLQHELTHLRRSKSIGTWRWHGKYAISRHFRFEEEVQAYKEQFVHLRRHGIEPDVTDIAHKLSGKLYLWPVDYKEALSALKKLE
jgi:hypothetical protein